MNRAQEVTTCGGKTGNEWEGGELSGQRRGHEQVNQGVAPNGENYDRVAHTKTQAARKIVKHRSKSPESHGRGQLHKSKPPESA